jgi:hypothetical protein
MLAILIFSSASPDAFAQAGLVHASSMEQISVYLEGSDSSEALAIGGTRAKAIGGTRAKAIGGTRAKAIGGTRAKAIGGTRAKAIGGTRAKAIGGTRAKAIGGTRAKAIGGTRAKAIGGTRAKAIGGTRAKAIGGTRAKAIGGTRAKGIGFSYVLSNLNQSPAADSGFIAETSLGVDGNTNSRPKDRIVWNDVSYDWIIVGPASLSVNGDTISVLGVKAEIPITEIPRINSAVSDGQLIAVLGYADSTSATIVPTGIPFVSGFTEVVLVGQVSSAGSDGTVSLLNGLIVDVGAVPAADVQSLSRGDWVSVRGTYFPIF